MERTVGQNLRALRTERGLSQEELAARLGTTKQVVSRYENGQRTPKVTVVEAIARRLGVPLAALLGEAAAQSGALREPGKGRVCERGTEMSAANFGREATHALRVTGPPGFAESEMTVSARQGPEISLFLSWNQERKRRFSKKRKPETSAPELILKNLPPPRRF